MKIKFNNVLLNLNVFKNPGLVMIDGKPFSIVRIDSSEGINGFHTEIELRGSIYYSYERFPGLKAVSEELAEKRKMQTKNRLKNKIARLQKKLEGIDND